MVPAERARGLFREAGRAVEGGGRGD
jgi:hypothetical protein